MVSPQEINAYCDGIAAAFRPQRIILFGSHASGESGADSDVDVLVIVKSIRPLGQHPAAAIRMKVHANFSVDMLVRDAREVARRLKQRDLFMSDVIEKGRVMYEADDEKY